MSYFLLNICKFLLFLLFLLFVFLTNYFIGNFVTHILKIENDIIEKTVTGFVTNLAINQFILWPFVAFRLSFNIFFILMLILTLSLTSCGFYFWIKGKNIKEFQFKVFSKKIDIYKIVFSIMIIIELVLTSFYYRSDADDSFYVSNSNQFANSKYINQYDSSLGNKELGTVPMYDFQIWKSMIAVYSKIFRIESVIISHTFLVPILIIFSAFANYLLGRKLLKSKSKGFMFSAILIVFNLFSGFSVYSIGNMVLSRIWQGKAVYFSIILPTMIGLILDNTDKINKNIYLILLFCTLAGIALNPTSMFIIGFQLIFMIIALSVYNKNYKYLIHAIPSILSIIFFTLCIYLRTKNYTEQIANASTISYREIIEIFKRFFANKSFIYLVLYIIGMFFIFKHGNKEQKIYLIFTPLLLLLFIWNPISGKFVAEKITKTSTYWRVYWLLPYTQSIAITAIILYEKINKKSLKYVFIICTTFVICISGKWLISKQNNFIYCNNFEKVPNDTIELGNIINNYNSENKILIAKDEINTTMRQKYNDIELIFSRYQYILDLIGYRGNKTEADERVKLQDIINGEVEKIEDFENLSQKYNVGWIIIDKINKNIANEICKYDYSIYYSSNESILLKRNDI